MLRCDHEPHDSVGVVLTVQTTRRGERDGCGDVNAEPSRKDEAHAHRHEYQEQCHGRHKSRQDGHVQRTELRGGRVQGGTVEDGDAGRNSHFVRFRSVEIFYALQLLLGREDNGFLLARTNEMVRLVRNEGHLAVRT